MTEMGAPMQFKRAAWHTRVQALVFVWFALAAVVAAVRFDDWQWLLVHFLMLGAVSNALFIWSWHFTGAILRVPDQADRSSEIQRLLGLNLGIAGTVIGVRTEALAVMLASVALVSAAVFLHAQAMRAAAQRSLASPYAFTVRAYIAACALLVPGLLLGAWMETLSDQDPLRAQLLLAHVSLNLLGWVGLPILGTIVTLWPTMLRTRIAPNAALLGRKTLPLLVAGVLGTATGFAVAVPAMAVVGLSIYLVGFIRTLQPMLVVLRVKKPASFATWSTTAGMAWLFLAVLALALRSSTTTAISVVAQAAPWIAFVGVVGVLQVLIGCMAYLVPSMAAGGPAIVRLRNDIADAGMVSRVALVNVGAVSALVPVTRLAGALMLAFGTLWSLTRIALSVPTPAVERVAEAEAARVWEDEKEIRRFPFDRRKS